MSVGSLWFVFGCWFNVTFATGYLCFVGDFRVCVLLVVGLLLVGVFGWVVAFVCYLLDFLFNSVDLHTSFVLFLFASFGLFILDDVLLCLLLGLLYCGGLYVCGCWSLWLFVLGWVGQMLICLGLDW